MTKDKVLSKTVGRRLRDLRRAKGVSSTQTLEKMMGCKYSYSNISRRETGDLKVDFQYLTDFCNALKLTVAESNLLMASVRVNQLRPAGTLQESVEEWSKIASNGRSYQHYDTDIIGTYLQTHNYLKAHALVRHNVPDDVEKSTKERIDNADYILSDSSREFRFLLHENVFYFTVGSPQIMIEQLEKLLAFRDEPNIELRVLPRGAFVPVRLYSCFFLIDSNFCFCQSRLDFSIVDEISSVRRFQSDFDKLWVKIVWSIKSLRRGQTLIVAGESSAGG